MHGRYFIHAQTHTHLKKKKFPVHSLNRYYTMCLEKQRRKDGQKIARIREVINSKQSNKRFIDKNRKFSCFLSIKRHKSHHLIFYEKAKAEIMLINSSQQSLLVRIYFNGLFIIKTNDSLLCR